NGKVFAVRLSAADLAWILAGLPGGTGLWLPRAWPLGSRPGFALQSAPVAAGPLRPPTGGAVPVVRSGVRFRAGNSRGRLATKHPGQRTLCAEGRGDGTRPSNGTRRAGNSVVRNHTLRMQCARLHHALS